MGADSRILETHRISRQWGSEGFKGEHDTERFQEKHGSGGFQGKHGSGGFQGNKVMRDQRGSFVPRRLGEASVTEERVDK